MMLWLSQHASRLVIVLLIGLTGTVAGGEDDSEFSFEESWKQYEEIIVSVAADFDSPIQPQAFQLVEQNALKDSRFDEPVRNALEPSEVIDDPSDRRRVAAIHLLPFTTISHADQVALLLDLAVARSKNSNSGEHRSVDGGFPGFWGNASAVGKQTTSRLMQLPTPLAEELAKRLAAEDPPVIYYHAAGFTGPAGSTLMPLLLRAAQSDDQSVQAAAFQAAGNVLAELRRHEKSVRQVTEAQAKPSAEQLQAAADRADVPVQTLQYAHRIVSRADRNRDGVLTADEWKDMLVDPSKADADGDGRVTAEEYAIWMQSRSKR